MPTISRTEGLAYAGMAATNLIWAGNNVVARGVAEHIPPVSLSFWRWAVALLFILPFAWRHLVRDRAAVRSNLRPLFAMATLGIAGFNTLLYGAAHTTTAINITLVAQLVPIATLLLAWWFLADRPSRRQLLGVLVSLAGVLIIIGQGSIEVFRTLSFNPGDLIMTWAVLVVALYMVLLKHYSLPMHPLSLLTCLIAAGVALLLPVYLWEWSFHGAFELTWVSVGAILYTGILASAVANLFFNNAIAVLGPAMTAIFSYLQPLFAIALAIPLLGEELHVFHGTGGLLIIAGVALTMLRSSRAGA